MEKQIDKLLKDHMEKSIVDIKEKVENCFEKEIKEIFEEVKRAIKKY